MIDILGQIPRKVSIAFSGGVDSVAIHNFLSNNHEVEILHFNHGETDKSSFACANFAYKTANNYNQKIYVGEPSRKKYGNESMEEYWRNMRYEWFHSMEDRFIVTGHHLNDIIEWWIFSSLHGEGKIMPFKNKNVYRPFILNEKKKFIDWCERKKLQYVQDDSNFVNDKMRNYIRNVMMPHCLHVNPGLDKVVKRKIIEQSSSFYSLSDMDFENIYVK